jgi:hypothetical protein
LPASVSDFAQGQHADAVAVLLAEQRHGAGLDGLLRGHFLGLGRDVLADHRVDLGLDALDLVGGQRAAVAEVEAHAVAVDHLALLGDVRAQHMVQGGVHQVGGRVVGAGGGGAFGVDRGHDLVADLQGPASSTRWTYRSPACFWVSTTRLLDAAIGLDHAGVAGLAAALGVEAGAVQQDVDGRPACGRLETSAPSSTMAFTTPVVSVFS